MTLDKASLALFEAGRAKATKPREEMSPAEQRDGVAAMRAVMADGAAMTRTDDFEIPVSGGKIPARLYVPIADPIGIVAYFHGGGWVAGSLDVFDPFCREIAASTGCALVSIEYRKAPEHPFPVPVDDAWAGLRWVADNRDRLAAPGLPLAIAGDSAGANLAIACTQRAHVAGGPVLAGQLLIYPVTDCNFATDSYLDSENQLSLTRGAMMRYWDHYVPDAAQREKAEVSPLGRADMKGMPPAIVISAEHDVLRDEAEAFAQQLRDAGIEVISRRFEGQLHAFAMMVGVLPGSASAIEFIGKNLPPLLMPRTA